MTWVPRIAFKTKDVQRLQAAVRPARTDDVAYVVGRGARECVLRTGDLKHDITWALYIQIWAAEIIKNQNSN